MSENLAPVVPPVVVPPAPPQDDEGNASLSAAELRTLLREKGRTEGGLRTKLRDAESAAVAALAAAEALKTEHTTALTAAQEAADARAMKAELRIEATKAGIVDLDALALLDLKKSGVKLDKDGEIVGAADAIKAFKEAKPHFFGGTGSTSSTTTAPKPAPSGAKRAVEMSAEEYKAERSRLVNAR